MSFIYSQQFGLFSRSNQVSIITSSRHYGLITNTHPEVLKWTGVLQPAALVAMK